jgi:hypothetical protein
MPEGGPGDIVIVIFWIDNLQWLEKVGVPREDCHGEFARASVEASDVAASTKLEPVRRIHLPSAASRNH